jgi:hypothetical protein
MKWRTDGIFVAEYDGFVHSEPMLDFVSVARKHNPCILDIIVDDITGQPTTITILKEERKIPLKLR